MSDQGSDGVDGTSTARRRRRSTVVGAAVVAVAAGIVAMWTVVRRPGATSPAPIDTAWAQSMLTDPTNRGLVRPTGLVPGYVLAAAGPYLAVEQDEPVADDGRVAPYRMRIVDARTGQVAWTIDEKVVVSGSRDGTRFLVVRAGELSAREAGTGATVWTRPVTTPVRVLDDGGVAMLVDGSDADRPDLVVVDPASGAEVRRIAQPCAGTVDLPTDGPLVVTCTPAQGDVATRVYGPGGTVPTWQTTTSRRPLLDVLAPGLLEVLAGDHRMVVVAATGRVVPVPESLEALHADRTALLALDRSSGEVRRLDLDTGAVVDTVTLAGWPTVPLGGGKITHVVIRGGWAMALREDGQRDPADRYRDGVIVWDLGTGREIERSTVGPSVARPVDLRLVRAQVWGDAVITTADVPGTSGVVTVVWTIAD